MSLTLYSHPFASFCQKVLIALYENETPFEAILVDLGDEASRAAFLKIRPEGKMPVLRDEARNQTVPETSIIIEYLSRHYPGRTALVPQDPDLARETRLLDRFFDIYVSEPMQKVVGDRLRPDGAGDPFGVTQAKAALRQAYGTLEQQLGDKTWAIGEAFSMADCSAAPALYYANQVAPFGAAHPKLRAYLKRLHERPSYARVVREAEPYAGLFPREK